MTSDFVVQTFFKDIPSGGTTVDATAPADFVAVANITRTLVLLSSVTQHAMGQVNETTNRPPRDVTARVELINASTIRFTRSGSPAFEDRVRVVVIEYIGLPGGADEFIVRDRRTHSWTGPDGSPSLDTYDPAIGDINTTAIVSYTKTVVFSGGQENPNSTSDPDRKHLMSAYVDIASQVRLRVSNSTAIGSPATLVKSSWQTVEFVGSNWTVQTGETMPAASPSAASATVAAADPTRSWVYFTYTSGTGGLRDLGGRVWLDNSTTLKLQCTNGSTASNKFFRWFIITNPTINVQRFQSDNQFSSVKTASITVTPVIDATASFAWVTGETPDPAISNETLRAFWQTHLSSINIVSLARGLSGSVLDYDYQIIEFPLTTIPGVCTLGYYQRAFDSGTGGYVYWTTVTPNPTPSSFITQPNFTGVLSLYVILNIIEKEV